MVNMTPCGRASVGLAVVLAFVTCLTASGAGGDGGSQGQSAAMKPGEMFQDIFPLTAENFTEKVLRNKDPWIVLFHDGAMEKRWKTMATYLRGLVWIGMIDITKENDLLKHVQYDPTHDSVARVYPYGGRQVKATKWEVAKTPNEASASATRSIPDRTHRVKESNIQDFLMESYSAEPSRFPTLYLTEEQSTPSLLKALSVRFEKYFSFGRVVQPTTGDLEQLGLADIFVETPALFVLITDQNDQDKFNAVQYDESRLGALNYTNVMEFLFAVNDKFRYTLLGENQSEQQTEAEMSDVIEIERERFHIVSSGSQPSSGKGDISTKTDSSPESSSPKTKEEL